mmetsp:Transcript_10308/g.32847  ORF Transcript_10308/g.32847 Transcript_10308/m.32847 type:complete len:214 (+) Transcript_10308:1539-2180(+)
MLQLPEAYDLTLGGCPTRKALERGCGFAAARDLALEKKGCLELAGRHAPHPALQDDGSPGLSLERRGPAPRQVPTRGLLDAAHRSLDQRKPALLEEGTHAPLDAHDLLRHNAQADVERDDPRLPKEHARLANEHLRVVEHELIEELIDKLGCLVARRPINQQAWLRQDPVVRHKRRVRHVRGEGTLAHLAHGQEPVALELAPHKRVVECLGLA